MRIGNYRFDENLFVEILEKVALAAIVLLITWALARAAKWAFAKLVDNVSFFRHHTGDGSTLGASLGKIVSLLIWLFGLIILLQVLGLGEVAGPIDNLLDNVVRYIPNLVGAGLIFFIGLMVAKIVRELTVTALQTVDFDKWVNRGGVSEATGNHALSRTIGTILYAIIVIFVAIAALEVLNIQSISEPASDMLQIIFAAIPNIIAAAILLGIGYLISRFVVQILKEVLPGLGVDRALSDSGIVGTNTKASSVIARVAQIGIVLFFAIAATRILNFPELTAILNEVLELGGQVVFGAVVIGIGFFIAGLLANLIGGAGEQTTAGTIVKWATILLFTFMGLLFMGVGEAIVQTAFSAIVIGGAVAAALAFGLGGREWAGRKLEEMDSAAKNGALRKSTTPTSSTTSATTTRPGAPESDKPLPPGA
ncbi:mechanosensitive ion channel [Altererythrobacter aurantiacus]|uniref:Small-conductance mechanosensitive channel n=1 Tax=Parapontixanthobacter aurantiacus TaxID=1463599 RepID=A0A844ZHL7_9SPHN|nr:mechanosensitive ion channel [Parapontixanthobacter aurantiacus]MXO86437.1 mechanosensitive ion channel [Parapontixanthobacter aurantiacus]